MFKTKRQLQQRIDELEARLEAVTKTADHMLQRAYLVDIVRDGRKNTFMFVRHGEIHTIDTMGLISDNPTQWKKDLME